MPRMKHDEIRFRKVLAASGRRIEEVDPLEIARRAKVNPRRAKHFARVIAGPSIPAEIVVAEAMKGTEQDAEVQGPGRTDVAD